MNRVAPLALGEYAAGVDDLGRELNADLLGKRHIWNFSDFRTALGTPVKQRLSAAQVTVVVVRNKTGGTLAASDVVQLNVTDTISVDANGDPKSSGFGAIPLLEQVKKKADANGLAFCGVVDPSLRGTTVPANGIFNLVISGPCEARLPATSPTLSIGSPLMSAATGAISLFPSETAFPLAITAAKVHDAMATNCPATAANDDMGIITGTPGTDAPTLQGVDFGGTTTDEKCAYEFILPEDYSPGAAITVRAHAGILTTVSDGTLTLDVEAWKVGADGVVGSDLCTTAAQSINSLTQADKDFTITPTGLVAGDKLIIRFSFACSDTGNAGVMIPEISALHIVTSTANTTNAVMGYALQSRATPTNDAGLVLAVLRDPFG